MLHYNDAFYHDTLYHHGVKGMHWGIRRYQNKDGSLTKAGKKRYSYSPGDSVFISGKVSYDRPIDDNVKQVIDEMIRSGVKINIGDAPGADTRVQDYLASKKYQNVLVYSTDDKVRNNVGKWDVKYFRPQSGSNMTEREVRRLKDIAMTSASNKGFAISPSDDRPDSATALNISRLIGENKPVSVYNFDQEKYRYR